MENLNPDLNKVKELALKLKEMADRGTENEKTVAAKKLNTLLQKYKLTIKDIRENKLKERTFPFKHEDERMIVAHVIWSVSPESDIYRKGKVKKAYCKLLPEKYIEIKEKLKFYLSDYVEQKSTFTIAYILRNNLEVKTPDKSSDSEKQKENKDSIDLKAIGDMMNGLKQVNYQSKKRQISEAK